MLGEISILYGTAGGGGACEAGGAGACEAGGAGDGATMDIVQQLFFTFKSGMFIVYRKATQRDNQQTMAMFPQFFFKIKALFVNFSTCFRHFRLKM